MCWIHKEKGLSNHVLPLILITLKKKSIICILWIEPIVSGHQVLLDLRSNRSQSQS